MTSIDKRGGYNGSPVKVVPKPTSSGASSNVSSTNGQSARSSAAS